MKKKNFTDLGPGAYIDELDEEYSEAPSHREVSRTIEPAAEGDATSVFDLVHRGRQRQQHFKAL